MLKTKIILLSMLILSANVTLTAQKKKAAKKANVTEMTEQKKKAEELYELMLPSTAQLMIIDSIVTDSADFITKIPIYKQLGQIITYDRFWKKTGHESSYLYINEFGNKTFYSKVDGNGHFKLYTADKLGGEWTGLKQINDFGEEFEDINYPFMMPDGTTLYFAAKSKEGLGGYDIYVTRYDVNSAKFYKPENLGLPYNSKGNDYFCIIDEFNELGWLVTDRRQPDGKVCIYTFIPSKGRNTYDVESVGEDKLRNLSVITSLKDTWTDKAELQAARNRLKNLMIRQSETEGNSITFIINDNTVYKSIRDFKVAKNRQRFDELQSIRQQAANMSEKLEAMRETYSGGSASVKRKLAGTIKSSEQKLEQTCGYIRTLEKDIRNTENMAMSKD